MLYILATRTYCDHCTPQFLVMLNLKNWLLKYTIHLNCHSTITLKVMKKINNHFTHHENPIKMVLNIDVSDESCKSL